MYDIILLYLDNQINEYIIELIKILFINAKKRKVPLKILLQRASLGEKEQRILKRKWPWSGAPKF